MRALDEDTFRAGACVVTGASSGIGRAASTRLVADGMHVVGVCLDAPGLDVLAEELGDRFIALHGDVADETTFKRAIELARARANLVGWVNNAAAFEASSFVDAAPSFARTFDVNLVAAVRGTAEAAQEYIRTGLAGSIVNVSSVQARLPMPNWVGYGVAKAGIEGLTRATASDLGQLGIRSNAVAPGSIVVERNVTDFETMAPDLARERQDEMRGKAPLRRRGQASEVAAAIRFLLSPEASFISGVVLPVDGGWSSWSYLSWETHP
jgi:NAD(P)-dependent dehydrogenase (short-subunit alcohol dehydrogenase family)